MFESREPRLQRRHECLRQSSTMADVLKNVSGHCWTGVPCCCFLRLASPGSLAKAGPQTPEAKPQALNPKLALRKDKERANIKRNKRPPLGQDFGKH